MAFNFPNPPLIPGNTNNDNNTTRIMQTGTVYSDIITDNIATLENGFLSDLIEPTANNQIATKFYVDNSGGGGVISGPLNSVQFNDSNNFGGSANFTLTNPNLINETVTLNGTLTNGTITTIPGQFNNLDDPVASNEAATKNYVDQSFNKQLTTSPLFFNLEGLTLPIILTPAETYNNILIAQNDNSGICFPGALVLATPADMKTFLGNEYQIGKSWTTILIGPTDTYVVYINNISGPYPIAFYFFGFPLPGAINANLVNISILSIITDDTPGSEAYTSYVTTVASNYISDAQITDQGVRTPSFANGTLISPGILILPVPLSPIINSNLPHVYTYTNLKQVLIVRTGLTGIVNDTFEIATTFVTNSDFLMGGGTFKFFIQNPTLFDINLIPSAGWSFAAGSSSTITSLHCGTFWVTVDLAGPTCLIRSMGIHPLNG